MKKSKFTADQIAFALKQAELTPLAPAGGGKPQAQADVADLSLDKAMLQAVVAKKL